MASMTTDVDLTDPESIVTSLLYGEPLARENPYELYAALRSQTPVLESERGMWVLSDYAGVLAALRHPGSSMSAGLMADRRYPTSVTLQTFATTMLFRDDRDAHARERRLVRQAFTRQTVQGLRPQTEEQVSALLDACAEKGAFDYMGDFIDHIPVAVICRMLGVPASDIPIFIEWNYLITTTTGVVVTDEHMARVDEATTSLLAYLRDLLELRKRTPGDDLITRLIEARDGSDQLSDEECMGMAFLLLVAGSDTTAAFLGAATVALLRNQDQLRLLREDRSLLPNAIEELMRFEAPVHFGIMRTLTEPLALGDAVIPEGASVWTILSGANRDPARFPDPDRLDLRRPDVRHLGFAQGMHVCLGAMLARLEATVVLEAVLDRFEELELVDEQVAWVNHGNLRALHHLNVAGVAA